MCGHTVTCRAGRDRSERRNSISHPAGTGEPQRWPRASPAACGSSHVPGAAASPALPLLVRAVLYKHWYPASSNGCLLATVPRIWFKHVIYTNTVLLSLFTVFCFLSKGTDRETAQRDGLQQGSGRTLPLSEKEERQRRQLLHQVKAVSLSCAVTNQCSMRVQIVALLPTFAPHVSSQTQGCQYAASVVEEGRSGTLRMAVFSGV